MATTKIYLDDRKGVPPFQLKIRITHERNTVYILTGFKLNPDQWNSVQAVKHPRAAMINNQINARKAEIDCKLFEWQAQGKLKGKTAKQIKQMLECNNGEIAMPSTFGTYFKQYTATKKRTYSTYIRIYIQETCRVLRY